MSAFERHAAKLLIEKANAAGVGVELTAEVAESLSCRGKPWAAQRWVELHPDDTTVCGCWGFALDGPASCTCWQPVFVGEQLPPRPPADADEIGTAAVMCGDCAFRPGSPERAEQWTEDALMDLAASGVPFWCHQGMRRPDHWVHPDGRRVDGSPDDWQPPIVRGVPFRLDGSPGLMCAGWAAVGRRFDRDGRAEDLADAAAALEAGEAS